MFTLFSTLNLRALLWTCSIRWYFTFRSFNICCGLCGDILLWCYCNQEWRHQNRRWRHYKFLETSLCFLLWSWLAFLLCSWVTLLFLTISCGWLGFLSTSWLFFKRISCTAYNNGNKQKFRNARKIKEPNSIGRKYAFVLIIKMYFCGQSENLSWSGLSRFLLLIVN